MGERIIRRIVVGGRVQGVGFRAFVEERALATGVAGWVRNRMDRTVECVIAGDPAAVEAIIAACRSGPLSARVDRCEVTEAGEGDLAVVRRGERFSVLATR